MTIQKDQSHPLATYCPPMFFANELSNNRNCFLAWFFFAQIFKFIQLVIYQIPLYFNKDHIIRRLVKQLNNIERPYYKSCSSYL
jgi:hypothetical protein